MASGIILKTERGEDLVFEWKIGKIPNLPKRKRKYYLSPVFSFGNETWYLMMFMKGSIRNDSSGDVDLSLCKCYSNLSIKQSFSLSLKTTKEEKYNEQHCIKEFDNDDFFHRFYQFIPKSELTRRRSDLMPEGVLTVVCTMKSWASARSDSNSGFAEHCLSDSDSAERSSDSDSGECCHKCLNCLDVVKMQKKLLKELESQKKRSEDECCDEGAQSLCEDYQKLLLGGRHHDVILKVDDEEHQDILKTRSKVFESMLDPDIKEKSSVVINVPDCNPNAMELFLSYVYGEKIESLDHSNMLNLYDIADKHEMMELKRDCSKFIKESLSLTNICSVIQLALRHRDSDLLEHATAYFADNVLDVLQTVEWQSFLKDNSTVGNELFIKSIKLKNAQS